MPKFLTLLKDKYVASKGFHTKRKLVVIESDDWGSIRMPSKETLDKEFPEYSYVKIGMPSEHMRRVGQSIAAASLPENKE